MIATVILGILLGVWAGGDCCRGTGLVVVEAAQVIRACVLALLLAGCATAPQRPAWPLDRMSDAIDHCMVLGEAVEVIRAGDCAVVVCTESP